MICTGLLKQTAKPLWAKDLHLEANLKNSVKKQRDDHNVFGS